MSLSGSSPSEEWRDASGKTGHPVRCSQLPVRQWGMMNDRIQAIRMPHGTAAVNRQRLRGSGSIQACGQEGKCRAV
jgi:hypothetical protein